METATSILCSSGVGLAGTLLTPTHASRPDASGASSHHARPPRAVHPGAALADTANLPADDSPMRRGSKVKRTWAAVPWRRSADCSLRPAVRTAMPPCGTAPGAARSSTGTSRAAPAA
jgi:hypothetical protein